MPRTTKSEPTKKHGDKMEPLIERTERDPALREGTRRGGDDPGALQDDDDEDIENDDAEDRRDIGERR
jgi:hypothetical protein